MEKKDELEKALVPEPLREVEGLIAFDALSIPPCVYFLIQQDEVVYVGQTKTLARRIHSHREMPVKKFDRVFYIAVPPENLLSVESEFIWSLNPRFNHGYERRAWEKANPPPPIPEFKSDEHVEQFIRMKNLEKYNFSRAELRKHMRRIYGSKLIGDTL